MDKKKGTSGEIPFLNILFGDSLTCQVLSGTTASGDTAAVRNSSFRRHCSYQEQQLPVVLQLEHSDCPKSIFESSLNPIPVKSILTIWACFMKSLSTTNWNPLTL